APAVPAAKPLPRWVRPAAYAFAIAVVVSSATWYYTLWRDDQRVVLVRVINTGSGDAVEYKVRKGSIEGRSFETVDGFIVRVADAERVEVQRLD
ncbi:MAG: antitermination protein NusG, partial [Gammaproteobacteria bacterium]|nr:antitermination protein NusG [Gammaproteobacteria bacterium]